MHTATIGTKTAMLRDRSGGASMLRLAKGDRVTVVETEGASVRVKVKGKTGVLARRVLDLPPPAGRQRVPRRPAPAPIVVDDLETNRELLEALTAAPAMPPEAAAWDIKVVGKAVLGPGGIRFGTLFKLGLFQYGATGLAEFFAQDPDAFPGLKPALGAVMRSVSENEGKIEAINTWDAAFLSVGIYQWTAGVDGGAGELAHLLATVKARAPTAFATYFGKYGLDVVMPGGPSKLPTGHLVLDGSKLDTAAKKAALRSHLWSYRFWRAAHDTEVRRAQVKIAMDRIDAFYPVKIPTLGRKVSDYISSQYGVAQLLDQHVNRPGHVPKTLVGAIKTFVAGGGSANPATWSTTHEKKVLALYLKDRHTTNMTDSVKRAERIAARVKDGTLSDQRGSF